MTKKTARSRSATSIVNIGLIFGLSALISCSGPSKRVQPGVDLGREAPEDARSTSPMVAPQSGAAGMGPQEAADFAALHGYYNSREFEALIEKAEDFLKKHPKSTQAAGAANLRGLGYLLSRRPQLAIPVFKRALSINPDNQAFNRYVQYNLAKAQFDSSQFDEAYKTANEIPAQSLDRDNRLKLHYLKSRIYFRRALPLESAREALTASRLLSDLQIEESRDTRNTFVALIDQALGQVSSPEQLETLFREYESSPLADSVLFRLGAAQISAGNRSAGEGNLNSLMSRYPQSRYFAETVELLRSADRQAPVEPLAVGVLLPMKGKFAKFGLKNRQAIELAFGIFNSGSSDTKVTLVVEDSGEEPEQAIRALNRLVTRHHVVAVLGPLLSKGIDQITQRAHELGVPLVSLARYPGISSEYVFPAGLTLKSQAYEIARFATDRLGISKLAIAYPRDKIGEESMQHFWDAAQTERAEIVGAEAYNPGETDFRAVVDKLSGLAYPEARQRELDELAKQREELQIKKRNRKTEQYFGLKPLVSYEAVFIPEEAKTAGQLLPTFHYRDVSGIKFLGTSAWNTPELASRASGAAENSYFVDAFDPQSDSKLVKDFIAQFRSIYGQEPGTMDALAYDAAKLLQSVIPENSDLGRSQIRDRLRGIRDFPGVTGKISFQETEFTRGLAVFTFKQGKIVRAE